MLSLARQFRLKLERPEPFRREDFVQSPANAEAVRALDAWPAWHAGCLALIGSESSGKSHLALTWAERAGALVLGPADPIPCEGDAPRPILLEDADRSGDDERLFHLINRAGSAGGGLLLTARVSPLAWDARLPDLRSRLNALPVAEIAPPDDVILQSVLRKFFRERNIKPPEDLIAYLLRRIERSVPKALDIVRRLDDAADAQTRPISRALARELLENEPPTLNLFE